MGGSFSDTKRLLPTRRTTAGGQQYFRALYGKPQYQRRTEPKLFESLKDTHERSASAHFIIGYDGEIIQCIPFEEIAYAVKTRNYDSISIECCYKSADGSFTKETYDSLIHLLAYLVKNTDFPRMTFCGIMTVAAKMSALLCGA